MADYEDDAAPFKKTPNTKYGKGSPNAMNKSSLKRKYATERATWKKRKGRKQR